jgi:hypothetical protein
VLAPGTRSGLSGEVPDWNLAPARSKLITAENGFPDAKLVIVFHCQPEPSHFGPGRLGTSSVQ